MAWAKATPMPDEAPVMTATLPVSVNKSVIMLGSVTAAARYLAAPPRPAAGTTAGYVLATM
jgi:hypothetical protein